MVLAYASLPSASASFVPGQPYFFDTGTFWHGTHVAAIIGAPANNIGTVGIAPRATLIAVKVLHNGSGAFSWVIQGIVHAATPRSQGGAGAYGWAAGTSMASPAAAGVAALIVGKARSEGAKITPSFVRTQLEKSADDLGKPGNDDFYGAGRVNALRAVQ